MMLFLKQAELVISGNSKGNFRKTEGSGPSATFLSVLRPFKAMSQRRSKQSSVLFSSTDLIPQRISK